MRDSITSRMRPPVRTGCRRPRGHGRSRTCAFVEETGSTNADAAARLGHQRDLGSSIVAEHQTDGRGRKGRAVDLTTGRFAAGNDDSTPRDRCRRPLGGAFLDRACGATRPPSRTNSDDFALAKRFARGRQRKASRDSVRLARHRKLRLDRVRRRHQRAPPPGRSADRTHAGILRRRRSGSTARRCWLRCCGNTPRASRCWIARLASRAPGSPQRPSPALGTAFSTTAQRRRSTLPPCGLRKAEGWWSSATTADPKRSRWPMPARYASARCGRDSNGGRIPRKSAASCCRFRRSSSSNTSRSGRYSSASGRTHGPARAPTP